MDRRGTAGALAVGVGLLLAGCQGTTGERHAFPATWPGSRLPSPDAPVVQVLPIRITVAQAEEPLSSSEEGLPTAAVLSALFVKYLHVNGINAVLGPQQGATVHYLLQCDVPRLNYEVGTGYPPTRTYQAELACLLSDAQTRQTLWQRRLTQRYDRTTVLDLMTKLPAITHADDRIMYRECIVPLWDAMAQSVGTVVVSRHQAVSAIPEPEPSE